MENALMLNNKAKDLLTLLEGKAVEMGLNITVDHFHKNSENCFMIYIETPRIKLNEEMSAIDIEEFKKRNHIRNQFADYVLDVIRKTRITDNVKFSYSTILPKNAGFPCQVLK